METAISAVSGMMLEAVPLRITPTVRVANWSGSTSLGMIRFSAVLNSFAIIKGSTVFCGSDEWPPLP